MKKRIGSILHGALGDYYEQILCLLKYKEENPEIQLIAFFAVANRHQAFSHYDLSFFDEIYHIQSLGDVSIDKYYQFQIKDPELQENILHKLSDDEKAKFDFSGKLLPWKILKKHDFTTSPLTLHLNQKGLGYLQFVKDIHSIDDDTYRNTMKVGFLWRYRKKGINGFGQYPKKVVKKHVSNLMNYFISNYSAHIFVCGMGASNLHSLDCYERVVREGGIALGEHKYKFDGETLGIPDAQVTYLMGTGYAAEMEIMSQCDLLITMPSGFSEPLWMMKLQPVVMIFPPLEYLLRLWKHRMPLFGNDKLAGKIFNTFIFHSAKNVIRYLTFQGFLARRK